MSQINVRSFSGNYHTEEPQLSGHHNTQQNKQKPIQRLKNTDLSINVNCKNLQEHQVNVINSINLSGLQTEENEQSRQLLAEFSDVFTTNENSVDNVQDFQLKINLKDDISLSRPVIMSYHKVCINN